MKIKETIYTETYDDRGRLIKRVRTTNVTDLRPDFDDCGRDERAGFDGIQRVSVKRIREAVEDYRRTNEW